MRPLTRVALVLLLLVAALFFLVPALPMLVDARPVDFQCQPGKVRCEIGRLLLSLVPTVAQRLVLGITGVLVASGLIFLGDVILMGKRRARE